METYAYQLHSIGFKQLNTFQQDVFHEAIQKKSGVLAICLGGGKTILSLVLAFYFTQNNQLPILIVCSKSLITNWIEEIEKFYAKKIKYKVIHPTFCDVSQFKIKSKYHLYLTTADVLAKAYRDHFITNSFVNQTYINRGVFINNYNVPHRPYLSHSIAYGVLYSIKWGCLIVDEAQLYTNIKTFKCQSLGALCVKKRWLLSGTLFDEPKAAKILGYHIILNAPHKPRNLPDTKKLLKNEFKGLNEYLVEREKNEAFTPPPINDAIIAHQLKPEEEKIYLLMKDILIAVKEKAQKAKLLGDVTEKKKFSSYILAMVTYLRQALICPLLPLTSIMIDSTKMKKRSELSIIINNEIKKLGIDDYLNNVDNIKSSRISEIMKCINKHKNEKILVFSCYSSFLDILNHCLLQDKKNTFLLKRTMNILQRGQMVKDLSQSQSGVMLMTYELGSTGLNLQFASTVIIADHYWNAVASKQSIGRILRMGQVNEQVNIYFFTANSGIEEIIYKKQQAKEMIIEELKTGTSKLKIPKINMKEVIKIIEIHDNKKILREIYF